MGIRKKKKRVQPLQDDSQVKLPPRSLVVRSGQVEKSVNALVKDLRWVMQPNTAGKLKEKNSNKLKDYLALAGPFRISHLMVVTSTEKHTNLKICKLPRGPTLSFHINQFALMSDVAASLAHPKSFGGLLYSSSPLLVLNNMPTDRNEYHLLTVALQNMFPSINVSDVKISQIRRVILFHYQEENDTIAFRHYAIDIHTTGLTKGVKKILSSKILPNLHDYQDISDYIHQTELAADSEVEDNEQIVTLPENAHGRKKKKVEKRAVKLTELGPRMELSLFKIQDSLCTGEVLYHRHVQKTPEEIELLKKKNLQKQVHEDLQDQEDMEIETDTSE